jgi:hypothetical protein
MVPGGKAPTRTAGPSRSHPSFQPNRRPACASQRGSPAPPSVAGAQAACGRARARSWPTSCDERQEISRPYARARQATGTCALPDPREHEAKPRGGTERAYSRGQPACDGGNSINTTACRGTYEITATAPNNGRLARVLPINSKLKTTSSAQGSANELVWRGRYRYRFILRSATSHPTTASVERSCVALARHAFYHSFILAACTASHQPHKMALQQVVQKVRRLVSDPDARRLASNYGLSISDGTAPLLLGASLTLRSYLGGLRSLQELSLGSMYLRHDAPGWQRSPACDSQPEF